MTYRSRGAPAVWVLSHMGGFHDVRAGQLVTVGRRTMKVVWADDHTMTVVRLRWWERVSRCVGAALSYAWRELLYEIAEGQEVEAWLRGQRPYPAGGALPLASTYDREGVQTDCSDAEGITQART